MVLLAVLCFNLQAQNVKKLYETAELLFYSDEFEDALYGYEQIIDRQSDYQDVQYKVEICYLLTGDRDRPLDKIQSYQSSFGSQDPFYNYWMGRIYAYRYMYTDARAAWDEFTANAIDSSPEMEAELTRLIASTEKKMEFLESEEEYQITQLGTSVNSSDSELSPVYNARKNELIFTSSRGTSGEGFKVFKATEGDDGWGSTTEIVSLGTLGSSAPNIEVVNEDGRLFFFRAAGKGNLFYSESQGDSWAAPIEFDAKLSAREMGSHFFINEHEDRIIYATETKGRGLDLYEIFRDANTGEWSKPAPFNDAINSQMNEDSPYLTPDEKTLYFSSNGHGSIGGYDVFMSTYNDKTGLWSTPVSLGHPINSPDDELNFKINPDGKTGFFSSNRLYTNGEFDIFYFSRIEKMEMEGRVLAMGSRNPVPNASITFTARNIDAQFSSDVNSEGKYANEIIANQTYDVEIVRNGETILSDRFNIAKDTDISTVYIKDFLVDIEEEEKPAETKPAQEAVAATQARKPPSRPSTQSRTQSVASIEGPRFNDVEISGSGPAPTKSNFQQPVNYRVGKKVLTKNIYFLFGTAGLMQSATPVLEEIYRVLNGNPQMTVEIGGHTDNIGTEQTNMVISQNRALAVKGWLIRKGIADNRLYIRAYGESQPLASNDDEEDGRELNRRIEVRLVN